MTAVIARAAIVPVFAQPTLRSEQSTQLVLGETASVLETGAEWRRVRTDLDGYVGWVHAGYCVEAEEPAVMMTTSHSESAFAAIDFTASN